jgi:DNA-binding helix-hairpin-helix protein with protein kinase domain
VLPVSGEREEERAKEERVAVEDARELPSHTFSPLSSWVRVCRRFSLFRRPYKQPYRRSYTQDRTSVARGVQSGKHALQLVRSRKTHARLPSLPLLPATKSAFTDSPW